MMFFNFFCKSLAIRRHKKRNIRFKLLSKREESIAEKIGNEAFIVHKVTEQGGGWIQ